MDLPKSHVHPHHTGHRWVDYIIAGSALLVSVISLFLAIGHGRTMEKLVAANSWPNVEAVVSLRPDADGAAFGVGFRNSGVGPALVQSVEVWDGARPVASIKALLKTVADAGGTGSRPLDYLMSDVTGSVVASRETAKLLDVVLPKVPVVTLVPLSARLRVRVCYCSVFDDCYIRDTATPRARPEAVKACPVPAVAFDDGATDTIPGRQAQLPAR